MANRSLLRLVEFISSKFHTRMSAKQPTFKQRIRLLESAGRIVQAEAERCPEATKRLLLEQADTIFTEVEMMKLANQRWEAQRQARNAKTASKETALTS